MNNLWGSGLNYQVEYWPTWVLLLGVLVVAVLGALAIHGFLRVLLSPKKTVQQEEKHYLYSKAIRCWHWGNALLFILLLLSGFFNYFSLGNVPAQVLLHKICGYLIIAFWFGFILINAMTSNRVHYKVQFKGFMSRAIKQVIFYLFGIMKGKSHPFPASEKGKFNPIQQVAYLAVMYIVVPLLLFSGLLCLYPQWTGYGYWLLKGHFVLAVVGLLFIFVHIYLCTTGDTVGQTFKSMIDGFHRHGKSISASTSNKLEH